jgi:hypothetical protein
MRGGGGRETILNETQMMGRLLKHNILTSSFRSINYAIFAPFIRLL